MKDLAAFVGKKIVFYHFYKERLFWSTNRQFPVKFN